MKKKSLAFLATLCLAGGALGIFAACGGNQGTKDTYAPGDTIIEETETQYVYDSEGNVIYATQSGSSINVKYFVSETAYITLGGKKANEMQITGYSGEVTEVSVSAIEEAISVGDQKISIVGVADYAFKGCDTLTTADLTKREKSLSFEVGTGAFSSCINLASVTLPDNTQISDAKIDDGAFYGCLSLATVNVSDNFNEIGEYAFAFCASLNSFTVPEKVKVINASTFYACEKLNTVSFNGTAVRSIMDSAFADTALSSANLSAQTTLRYVGNNAFDNTAISRVSLPSSVSYIGYHAFYNCENLTTVNVPFLGNTINSSTSSAFTGIYGMSGEDERALSVTVDKVADIPDNAFNGYETLSSLTINSFADEATYYVYEADGITVDYKIDVEPTYEIGNSAFYNCKALSSVSIPSTTKAIGNSAFYGCEELNSATIPEKVESIGSYAFYGCDSIYEVEIPASVEYIGGGAFYDCNNLTGVTIGQLDRLVENEDYDSSSTSDPVVYKSLGALSNWMDVSDLRTVTVNSAYTLPNNFLDGAEYVNTVSVTFNKLSYEGKDYEETASIGAYAFRDCIRLNSLTLTNADNHIEEIGSYAFYRCNYLSSLTLPEGLDTIGSHAFDYCTKLSEITIPESVSSVGSGALANCYNLKTLTVKNYSWLETTETVTMVSEDPSDPYSDIVEQVSYSYEYKSLGRINTWFTGTEEYFTYTTEYSMGSSLGSIFTPNSLKTITLDNVCVLGANALSGFGGVKTINLTFVDQIKVPNEEVYYAEIDSYALYNCENLDTLNIEGAEYIDTIGNRAFMNCKSLDLDVAAFEELTMIGENAFSYTAIDSLTFGGRVMSIGNYAFAYCDNLEKVNISAALASIGNIIFMDSPVKELNICNYAGGAISDIASLFFNSYSYATSDCALETVTITGLEKFSDINAYAFRNLKTVKVISIDYAVDAENAEKVVIESTLFSGCDMLTNVYLPVAVEKVFIKSTLSNWNSSYSALNFSATEYYQLSSATTVPSEYNNYWCYNLGSVSEIEEPAYATNVTYTLNLNLGETAVSVDILAEDGILTQTAIDTAINTKLEELKTAAEEAGTEPAYTEFAKEGYSLLGWTLSISGKTMVSLPYYSTTSTYLYALWVETDDYDNKYVESKGLYEERGNKLIADVLTGTYTYTLTVFADKYVSFDYSVYKTSYNTFSIILTKASGSDTTITPSIITGENEGTFTRLLHAGETFTVKYTVSSYNVNNSAYITVPEIKDTAIARPTVPTAIKTWSIADDLSVLKVDGITGIEIDEDKFNEKISSYTGDLNSFTGKLEYANGKYQEMKYQKIGSEIYLDLNTNMYENTEFSYIEMPMYVSYYTYASSYERMYMNIGENWYYMSGNFGLAEALNPSAPVDAATVTGSTYVYDQTTGTYYCIVEGYVDNGTFVQAAVGATFTAEGDMYLTFVAYVNCNLSFTITYTNINNTTVTLPEDAIYFGSMGGY